MYVDGGVSNDLNTVGAQAAEMEDMGYSGVMTAETAHDPFFPLLVAAQNTCLLYTSPSPRDGLLSRMPSSA